MIQSQNEQTCIDLNPSCPAVLVCNCWNFRVVSEMYPFLSGPPFQGWGNQQQTAPPHSPARLHCLVSRALLWTELDLLSRPPPSTSQIPIQGAHSSNFCPPLCTNIFCPRLHLPFSGCFLGSSRNDQALAPPPPTFPGLGPGEPIPEAPSISCCILMVFPCYPICHPAAPGLGTSPSFVIVATALQVLSWFPLPEDTQDLPQHCSHLTANTYWYQRIDPAV